MPVVLWLVIGALSLLTAWMIAVTIDRPAPDEWGFRNVAAMLALGFGSVGALIATRRPGCRMGWMLLGKFTPIKSRLQSIVDTRLKTSRPGLGVAPAAALDVLVRLDQLRAGGVISAAEFETAKQSLLERAVSQAVVTEAVEA